MSASRSSDLSSASAEEPTPKPASAVGVSKSSEREMESSLQSAARRASLLGYFSDPPSEMRAMDAAWEEALSLYGDEDSDEWVAALEDGTHPLCRIRMPKQSA